MPSRVFPFILFLAVALAAPAIAQADCLTPEPDLLWSYPADGARDVPTNALFWFVSSQTSFNPELSATLNGKPLNWPESARSTWRNVSMSRVHVDPGPLAPNTAYTLVLRFGLGPKSGAYELHFTTGGGPGKPGEGARVIGHVADLPPQRPGVPCAELIGTQACFDMLTDTPPAWHRFVLQKSDAIAWFVQGEQADSNVLWPAECGMPRLFLQVVRPDACFNIQAITPGGLREPWTHFCLNDDKAAPADLLRASDAVPVAGLKPIHPAPPPPPVAAASSKAAAPPPAERDDGCSVSRVAAAPHGSAVLALMLAIATWRAVVGSTRRSRPRTTATRSTAPQRSRSSSTTPR